jgi:hypothetical protein
MQQQAGRLEQRGHQLLVIHIHHVNQLVQVVLHSGWLQLQQLRAAHKAAAPVCQTQRCLERNKLGQEVLRCDSSSNTIASTLLAGRRTAAS